MQMRQPSEQDRGNILALLAMPPNELFGYIADSDPRFQDVLFAPDEKGAAGRNIFSDMHDVLFQRLCVIGRMCERIDDPTLQDPVVLVAAIADAISTPSLGFPAFVIATLLFKIGVRTFCNCQ